MASLEYSLVSNIDKFQKAARVLGIESKDPLQSSMEVLDSMQKLLMQMEIKPLSRYTFTASLLELCAKQASRYDFMLSLSRPAGYFELTDIIKNAAASGISVSEELKMSKRAGV